MLKTIMRSPLEALVLGARAHALLAARMPESIEVCFERDDWTCSVCGIRLPGYMEVDHINGHEPCPADGIRTICQFCHNLRHAIWASNRGRLRILWSSELPQRQLTVLSWQVLLASPDGDGKSVDEELALAAETVARDAKKRERLLADTIGASYASSLLEALFSLRRLKGENAFAAAVDQLDRYVRFWPAAADRAMGHQVRAAADFGHWRDGGFRSLAADLIADHWKSPSSAERLRDLCGSHRLLSI